VAVPPVAVRRCRLAQPARKLTTVACAGVDVGDIQASVDWASTPAPLIVGLAVFTFSGIAAALPASLSPRQVVRGRLWAQKLPSRLPSRRDFGGLRSVLGCHSIRASCKVPDWGLKRASSWCAALPAPSLPSLLTLPSSAPACRCYGGEENKKLKAEFAELRTMDDADATLNSLVVELANTQAELAALRGPPSPEA
jgi:hypothetical protein